MCHGSIQFLKLIKIFFYNESMLILCCVICICCRNCWDIVSTTWRGNYTELLQYYSVWGDKQHLLSGADIFESLFNQNCQHNTRTSVLPGNYIAPLDQTNHFKYLKHYNGSKQYFGGKIIFLTTHPEQKGPGRKEKLQDAQQEQFPLAPMGVLAPGSAHTWPSAQPPIDTSEFFLPHVSGKGGSFQATLSTFRVFLKKN